MKHNNNIEKQTKNICSLNQKDKSDADPLVDLEIEGYHVRQVVLDFGSQVNIMTRDTWEQLGRPRLYELGIYLKLADQGLIKPFGVWTNVDMAIKGISNKVDFEIIDPKEGSSSFLALVGRPLGRKMKASICLDKERIKLKGNGQKVIVPIHPSQGEPWIEPIDEEVDIKKLYQIQNNEDYKEPNVYVELHLGNQDLVGYNSDAELYDWEV